jgi:hypothetical protein
MRTLDLRNSLIEGEAEAPDASISPDFTANSEIFVSRGAQVTSAAGNKQLFLEFDRPYSKESQKYWRKYVTGQP